MLLFAVGIGINLDIRTLISLIDSEINDIMRGNRMSWVMAKPAALF